MAGTPSYVQVAPDSTGKKIRNVELSVDSQDVQQQVTAQADPVDTEAVGRVRSGLPAADDYGVVTRTPAPSYDSGITNLPDTLSVLTADTIRADGILLCNRTTATKAIDLTNTAGDYYLKAFPLQAKMTVYLPLGRVTMIGVKWKADAVDSVNAQLVGEQ